MKTISRQPITQVEKIEIKELKIEKQLKMIILRAKKLHN